MGCKDCEKKAAKRNKKMTKKQEPRRICSKGHTLLLSTLYCLNKQCPDYKCVSVVDKCVHCIPVEPEPKLCAEDNICKGDSCSYWKQIKNGYYGCCLEADLQTEKHCTYGEAACPFDHRCEGCEYEQAPQMPQNQYINEEKHGLEYLAAENQRDADMAWFHKHCKACVELGKVMEFPEAHDQKVRKPIKEALQKALQLCDKVIELAERGDYSNGNTDGPIDEGSVFALRHLTELKGEYAALIEVVK
jgi:hypothetical protein